MPRSAAQSEEQTLQGSLFGAPEPAEPAKGRTSQPANPELEDLSDASLSADAAARPRQRQPSEQSTNPSADSTAEACDNDTSSDEPAWAHHSQLDPAQLTPMLRHYVELKAEHPERVLLYRLGDFFECFFEDKNNPRSNDSFLADATFRPSSNAYFTVSDACSVHQPH